MVLLVYANHPSNKIPIWNGGEYMNYGTILKACRTRARLSQSELADRLYINQSDVSKYENGTKEPSLSMAQAWTSNTQTQEVMVAFLCGVDGIGMMQSVLDFMSTTVNTILIGGIL